MSDLVGAKPSMLRVIQKTAASQISPSSCSFGSLLAANSDKMTSTTFDHGFIPKGGEDVRRRDGRRNGGRDFIFISGSETYSITLYPPLTETD